MKTSRIVIFNDTHGWHSEQLTRAFNDQGIEVVLTDLALCRIDLDYPSGLYIPGFENQLPDAVMVRGIAPGFLEQITLRMDVLHTLAELGIPVFNTATAIEHTVDKARTSLRLHLAGLSTPRTWACEDKQMAYDIASQQFAQGRQLVAKPLFGCQGKGIALLSDEIDLNHYQPIGDSFYLQEYIHPEQADQWQDWRLFVVDDLVCAAMSRRSQHWITNFAQGANCFATTVTPEMEMLAIAATQAVNASYAGVDLIRNNQGEFTVLEVNSVPAWKGLYQATHIDVAKHLATSLAQRIQASHHSTHAI